MHQRYRTFKTQADSLANLARDNFRAKSKRLLLQFEHEKQANTSNLESGIPLEDFFRTEFGELLHAPYEAGVGKIVDHHGNTCGECDFVIYNKRLAPLLKPPATANSRRRFFAFETTYGIVEVKQTLTLGACNTSSGALKDRPDGTLWDACTKVFSYKQLHRDLPHPIQWGINYPIGLLFFYNCDLDMAVPEKRDDLLREFTRINDLVRPEERVDGLYVLNRFGVNWSFKETPESSTHLTLQHVVETPAPAVWASLYFTREDTLYRMFTQLWSCLARTQLGAPDLLNEYGGRECNVGVDLWSVPASEAADREVLARRASNPEAPQ